MVTSVTRRQVNKKPGTTGHWSDRQKLEAVTTYMLVGKWPLVSDSTNIPIDTLKKWYRADWWKQYENEIRAGARIELGTKLATVRDKAIAVVQDRLEQGDIKFDAEGNIKRIPVNAKTAGDIMSKVLDKEFFLQKLEEKPIVQEEEFQARLKSIEAHLRMGAKQKANIIDVTPIVESLPMETNDVESR
jgi:hypothetical protein